jgi:hypothetical protein
MARRDSGPRRAKSVDAYLRGTRALAAIALLALVGGVLSDALEGTFWADHPLLAGLVASAEDRKRLHDKVTIFVEQNDVVLGRWAAVMLNADMYAEVIDRHVELAGDLAWLSSLLGFELTEDEVRAGEGRNHPAALIEGPLDDDQLVQRLAAITQLAEQLDRETLAVALRIVPVAWWREQLGVVPDTES